jgi:hypothetical protein
VKPATPQCKEIVVKYEGLARYQWQCKKNATKDGLCAIHHPDFTAKKHAKWKAESDARVAANALADKERKENKRRAEAYPRLVEALRDVLGQTGKDDLEAEASALELLCELGEQ